MCTIIQMGTNPKKGIKSISLFYKKIRSKTDFKISNYRKQFRNKKQSKKFNYNSFIPKVPKLGVCS